MVETQTTNDGFSVAEAIQHIIQENVAAETTKFLDINKVMDIRVTTAQQCANMNDHKDIALVIDMRSKNAFDQCSLDKSINFPLESFNEKTFINWAKEVPNLEKDATIFRDATQKKNF